MANWLNVPHFPQSKVACVALSSQETALANALASLFISVLPVPAHPFLSSPVASHADLNLLDCGNGNFLILPGASSSLSDSLHALGASVSFCTGTPGNHYPADALLDAAILGSDCLANPKTATPDLSVLCFQKSLRLISVKQGYTKCSLIPLPGGGLITEDSGIASTAHKHGYDVLLLRPGFVSLPGYSCGMIGGSCGMLSPDCLAFAGNWKLHPDATEIFAFCSNYHVFPEALASTPLRDVGGLLPLTIQP